MTNARSHDIWKTIGFSLASVGLLAMRQFAPTLVSLTFPAAVGAGLAAFGSVMTLKYHDDSIKKIKDYEYHLHSFAKEVEHDMEETD